MAKGRPSDILFPTARNEITAAETAEYLGTSVQMVRRYCRDGIIDSRKIRVPGKAEMVYMIPVQELHKLAFRRRKGQVRTRTVLSTGAVLYGPSLPARKES
jgi:hypothetical protein